MSAPVVGIVGAGSIGLAMAVVFAKAGSRVQVHEPSSEMTAGVPSRLDERLRLLSEAGLLTEPPADVAARISVGADLAAAVGDVDLVFECTPEDLETKRAVFREIAAAAPPQAILASTSSAFGAGEFAGELAGRERCLVLHPANPPYLIRVVEVVPAPFTAEDVVSRVTELLRAAYLIPVVLGAEVTGFVYNRLQGAVLREAYCLVRDGVIDVEGLDTIVREGLGLRWTVVGPFETADLNTRGGIAAHAARLGPAYERMGAERGQHDPWTPELVAEVAAQRRAILPLDEWEARTMWRDRHLAALRRHLDQQDERRLAPAESIRKELP
ncbi:3-hydroxyacyl-CoA dehydrogenase [Nonomuraea jiangxiensis]|uniref:3-hydroxyacyl-CoA dehydrogenase n=1 Tax=Nonomuraea jiangxiensis TaxID=633440 RepID=A0A1G9WAC9_9ACTN|nr:3-hydroxyacyl-CoA dehydrogenase [Nonomuraea jiangxiensis]SDM81181.1 3-hydroxyacyl-CoA dehydrogenase [Nonomuraea jiangxiensis]